MDKDLAHLFAANLRAAMGDKWNQNKLALALGMTRGGIGKLYHGKALPSVELLARMADLLKVSTDQLLGRKRARK